MVGVPVSTLQLTLDLIGIAAFAVSGAFVAVDKKLDIFGVVFVAAITALGGGFIRDALLGTTPAAALTDWRYLVTPLVVGLVVFYVHPAVARLSRLFLLVDAAGVGLFAVAAARKALDHGVGAAGACGIGLITAIGGGMLRDVIVREIPSVLHDREIYATPALIAAGLVAAGDGLGIDNVVVAVVSIAVAFALRVLGQWRNWTVPTSADT